MNVSDVFRELEDVINKYGTSGDRTFEYYGISVDNGQTVGSKLYRRLSDIVDENELSSNAFKFKRIKELIEYVTIYDFSSRKDNSGRTVYRIVFAPNKSVTENMKEFSRLLEICSSEQYSELLRNIFKCYNRYFVSGRSPLLKCGIEFNEQCDVVDMKIYFSLKRYDKRNDEYGRRYRYEDCRELLEAIMQSLGMSSFIDDFSRIAAETEASEYFPFFIGINLSAERVELKIYYDAVYSDFSAEHMLESGIKLIKTAFADNSSEYEELCKTLSDENIYPEISAYSHCVPSEANPAGIWRIYFTYMGEHFINAKMDDSSFYY